MEPVTAALVGGGIAAVGGLLGGKKAADANKATNARNLKFQYDMARSAHQWEVTDLQQAGLNPILSAGGSGASASGGSSVAVQNEMTEAMKGLAFARMQADVKKVDQETKTSEAQEHLIYEQAAKTLQDMHTSHANEKLTRTANKIQEGLVPSAKTMKDFDSTEAGKKLNQLKRIMDQVNPLKDTKRIFSNP